MTVVVAGATGNVGTPTVRALLEHDTNVHVLVRDPAKAASLFGSPPNLRITEVDFADRPAIAELMRSADGVFVALGASGEQAELQKRMIDAAAEAAVPRFLRLAVLGTSSSSLGFNQRAHAAIEEYQAAQELRGTSVRASIFHTNILSVSQSIRTRDEWVGAAPYGRQAFVDPEDVGGAVATMLTQAPAPPPQVELPGPDLLSYRDVACILTRLLGRAITYHALAEDEFIGLMRSRRIDEQTLRLLVNRDRAIEAHELETTSTKLSELLGRAPRDLPTFLAGHRADFDADTDARPR